MSAKDQIQAILEKKKYLVEPEHDQILCFYVLFSKSEFEHCSEESEKWNKQNGFVAVGGYCLERKDSETNKNLNLISLSLHINNKTIW